MHRRIGSPWIVLAFVFVATLGLSAAAKAEILKPAIGYSNLNFAKVILTYSWSRHYPGHAEVCLRPETVTVPAGGSVHLDPPAGLIPTDFVVISRILRGVDQGATRSSTRRPRRSWYASIPLTLSLVKGSGASPTSARRTSDPLSPTPRFR